MRISVNIVDFNFFFLNLVSLFRFLQVHPLRIAHNIHYHHCNKSIDNANDCQEDKVQPKWLRKVVLRCQDITLSNRRSTVNGTPVLVLDECLETILKHRNIL